MAENLFVAKNLLWNSDGSGPLGSKDDGVTLQRPTSMWIKEFLAMGEITTPSNPPAGSHKIYPKSDDKLYILNSAGTEATVGAGDVVGPGTSTDNEIPRYDGVTGKLLQGSGITVSDPSGGGQVLMLFPDGSTINLGGNGTFRTSSLELRAGGLINVGLSTEIRLGTRATMRVNQLVAFNLNFTDIGVPTPITGASNFRDFYIGRDVLWGADGAGDFGQPADRRPNDAYIKNSIVVGDASTTLTDGALTQSDNSVVDTSPGANLSIIAGSKTADNADGGDVILVPGLGFGTGVKGSVDVSSSQVINALDPTSDQHLATKKYVDDNVGAGDVVGPGSSTDSGLAVFDGITGKLLKSPTDTLIAGIMNVSGAYDVGPIRVNSVGIKNTGTNTELALEGGCFNIKATRVEAADADTDIGLASPSGSNLNFRDLYLSRNITGDGKLDMNNYSIEQVGTDTILSNVTESSSLKLGEFFSEISTHFSPATTAIHDLGTAGRQWRDINLRGNLLWQQQGSGNIGATNGDSPDIIFVKTEFRIGATTRITNIGISGTRIATDAALTGPFFELDGVVKFFNVGFIDHRVTTSGLMGLFQVNNSTGSSAGIRNSMIAQGNGDVYTLIQNNGGAAADTWHYGLDGDDSRAFVIGKGEVVGNTQALRIDNATRDILIHENLTVDGQAYSSQDTFAQAASDNHQINWDNGNSSVWDLQGATTASIFLTLTNGKAGASYIIKVIQSSTPNTIDWQFVPILWPGGVEPVLSTADDAEDIFALYFDGTNYYGTFNGDFS